MNSETSHHTIEVGSSTDCGDADISRCIRCKTTPADQLCCSSHNALLCHGCYRRTHFVEVCIAGCAACTRENLPLIFGGTA